MIAILPPERFNPDHPYIPGRDVREIVEKVNELVEAWNKLCK